jgi:ribosomal protein S18 acetylase RimI-like enzyme
MASAALLNSETKLVPIADADLTNLEKLFDEECIEWLELLKWDYKGASTLIRDVARQRQLSGFVATIAGATVGFAYYLVEGRRCSIGDIYVSKGFRGDGIDRELAAAVCDQLDRMARVRRIESQYVGIETHEADAFFQSREFERLERNYMLVELAQNSQSTSGDAASGESETAIRTWQATDFQQATRVIHRSYRGTHDSRINSQYRTEDGCAELLTILTDHIWCGDFLPQVSRVALRRSETMVGALIASRVSKGVGHIGQISVHPAHQGRGIGRALIASALAAFRRMGFKSITLAVTSANTSALHLYESCGFRTIHTFPVFHRERT